jgi:RND family efflux transporter MFP subunit
MTATPTRALTLVLLAALTGCDSGPARAPRDEVDRLPRVETVTPQYLEREETVELLATVEPLEKVDLCARVQAGTTGLRGMRGFIKTMASEIDIGLEVEAGQPLIQLELPDLAADREVKNSLLTLANKSLRHAEQAIQVAAADIKEAEAQILRYQADVGYKTLKQKRLARLVKSDTVQPELQEEADLELKTAQGALQTARAQLKTKKARYEAALREKDVAASKVQVAQAELKSLDVLTSFSKISAPFPAVITKRWVNSGDTIRDAAMPLLTVMRLDTVRVVIRVPERYVPSIRATQGKSPKGPPNRVKITIQSYQGEHQITRLASAVNDVTRLMRAEIHVKNDQELRLRPGMTGTATLTLSNGKEKRLTVPSTALVRIGDEIRVYYLDQRTKDNPPQGRVRSAAVTLGLDDGQTVEIKSGLTGSELVIARGNGVVREGETVVAVQARERRHE